MGSPPLARALQLQSPLPAMAATWRRAATHAAELEEQFAAWRSESPDAVTSLLDGAVHAFDGARDYAREHVALPRLAISPILGEIPPSVAHTWRAVGDAAAPSVRAVKDEVGELLEKLGKGGAATARGIGDMLELHRAEVVLDLSGASLEGPDVRGSAARWTMSVACGVLNRRCNAFTRARALQGPPSSALSLPDRLLRVLHRALSTDAEARRDVPAVARREAGVNDANGVAASRRAGDKAAAVGQQRQASAPH